jgi:hypothetical protein
MQSCPNSIQRLRPTRRNQPNDPGRKQLIAQTFPPHMTTPGTQMPGVLFSENDPRLRFDTALMGNFPQVECVDATVTASYDSSVSVAPRLRCHV